MTILRCRLCKVVLTTVVAATCGVFCSFAKAAEVDVPREVLAFFYEWYANPQVRGHWSHWVDPRPDQHAISSTLHYPVWGPYDSQDPAIIERQMTEAENAGLTGFIADFWGPDDPHTPIIKLLLDAAPRHHLKITLLIEKVEGKEEHLSERERETLGVRELEYILKQYASHPAFLTIGGRPVMFAYIRAINRGPKDWGAVIAAAERTTGVKPLLFADTNARTGPAQLLSEFYGLHRYGITGETHGLSREQLASWAATSYAGAVAEANGRISCVTISPGHDVSKVRKRPDPLSTDRMGGEAYRVLWQQAIKADPDWILINSWNEWHEGSELEPSIEFGHQALDDTKTYSKQFLALPPKKHNIP
jgi:hypothetical protein